jgi:arsenical pump membrane protein
MICAFIANAASFVLPISNPANLVVFGASMPPLTLWLMRFALPSIVSIALTFMTLRFALRGQLRGDLNAAPEPAPLTRGGALAALGIAATGLALIVASTLGWRLGLPTFVAGVLTAVVILIGAKQSPWSIVKDISWSVLPLVAGLFVLVEALQRTGVIAALAEATARQASQSISLTGIVAGVLVAFACNLMNNLPVGLIVGSTVAVGHLPDQIAGAALIGVDLGPNLSITGSLATILWLVALRREGERVSAWRFLKLGMFVMPPALIGAVLTLAFAAR